MALADKIESVLTDPNCFRGGGVQSLKAILDDLKSRVGQRLKEAQASASTELTDLKSGIQSMSGFKALDTNKVTQIETAFQRATERVHGARTVAETRDVPRSFRDSDYPRLLALASRSTGSGVQDPSEKFEIDFINVSKLAVKSKPMLSNESDVDEYVGALRDSLLVAIKSGKKIVL